MSAGKILFGLFFILVGFILLGNSLDFFDFDAGDVIRFLLPFIFIGLGIKLIIKKKREEEKLREKVKFSYTQSEQKSDNFQNKAQTGQAGQARQTSSDYNPETFASQQASQSTSTASNNYSSKASESPHREGNKLKFSKILGDMYIDFSNQSLENIDISSGIGDLEIKTKGGKLSQGLNRIIISGFIGDIRIFIPRTTPNFVQCSNFIGDIDMSGRRSDGFNNNVEYCSDDYNSAESKLFIQVNSFIGDVRIYHV